MKHRQRNIVFTLLFLVTFSFVKIFGSTVPDLFSYLITAIAPFLLLGLFLRYKQKTKRRQKWVIAAISSLAITMYMYLLSSAVEKFKPLFFEKYRLVFIWSILVPFIIGDILLIVCRFIDYDDVGRLL